MSIKLIGFNGPIQIPGRISVLSIWNATDQGKTIHVEETQQGVNLIMGVLDGGTWKATGDVVEVYRHKIDYVIRAAAPAKEQKK